MSRPGGTVFKGTPLTLAGDELVVGEAAPDFKLHFFQDGMQTLTLDALKGKPSLVCTVPSLDTPVCADQTRKFNDEVAKMGDAVNALTVSCDLPFAQGRFCGEHGVTNMRTASDYMTGQFGNDWGMMIEELRIHARGVIVLDADGKIVYVETVEQVGDHPNYDAALDALKGQLQSA